MTLTKCITDAVSDALNEFIDRIMSSGKCTLEREQLVALWGDEISNNNRTTSKKSSKKTDSSGLSGATKAELVTLCKKNGLKCTGKKDELIARLEEFENAPKTNQDETLGTTTDKETNSTATTRSKKDIAKFLKERLSGAQKEFILETNSFGNDVHEDTQLVFNRNSQAIGKQDPNGSISVLTMDDINICHKFGFDYIVPENLAQGTSDSVADAKEDSDLDMYSDGEETEMVEEEEEELEEIIDEEDYVE